MKHHYHVLNSFSGCLPETSYYCETKKDAITLAKSEARDYRDAEFYVAGNAEGGYEVKQNKDSYEIGRASCRERVSSPV